MSNVKAGVADMDAVNVSQLKDSGLIGDDGKAIAAVTYDRNADGTPNLGSVTLGGEGSTTPVALKNVADAKDDHDALNLGQLKNAGLVGEDANGDLTSAAVTYDTNADGTINHDKATLAGTDGTTLSNVKAGVADMDAVNVSQLKDSGLIGDDGKAIAAVTYDRNADGTPNLGSVTLGGEGSTTPVALKNVADAKDDHDALNLGQLKGTGLVGEDANGELTSAAVTYDTNTDGTINHDKATLAGTDGTTLSNVKAGVADMDAVNVSQLKDSGLIGDDGKAIAAVTYDRNADGTPNMGSVTLGGEGSTTPVALSNVKAGTADTDAVNVSQLKDSGLIGDDGKAIAAVTYDRNADGTPNLGSVTLGGEGSTTPVALKNVADAKDDHDALNLGQLKGTGLVGEDANGELTSAAVTYDTNTDGTINHDKATLAGTDGTTLSNVKAGVADMDAVNVSQLKDSGLIGDDGNAIAAVTYDRNADGTPNYNAVTLGGGNASGPVTLSNVAAGVAPTDAVNVQQMQKAVVEGNPYIGGFGANANTLAAQATKINAVALGLGSVANEVNTISVGNGGAGLLRRITNVQNGQADTDVATVGQVNELLGVTSTSTKTAISSIDTKTQSAIMDVNSRLDAINTMMNTTASTDPYVRVDGAGDGSDDAFAGSGTFGVAIGADASASGVTAVAIGPQAVSSGSAAVAIGAGASATSAGAVAFGSSSATGANALSLGNGTVATGNNSIAAGFNTQASGVNSFAMGNTARANAADSIAFGTTAQVDAAATNSIAIGRAANVTSTALNSVALGASSTADRLNSVSVGSSGQQRQIIYVARGTANTDAVNVSQLRDAVSAFGGKAGVGADGSIVNPTYTIDGKTYNNVGDALDALAATSGGGGANPLAVIYDDATKGSVTLGGTGSTTPVALSNVKAGTADTDAVNVSQLKDSGLIGDDGKAIAAVTYDRNADGTPNLGSVTLGGEGSTTPVALKNVADAKDDHDALNLGQLKNAGLVGEDTNGELTSAAVTYDTNTDGTINHDKATLAGTDGTTLSNVKAGVADMDAVNVSQLKDSGLIGDDGKAIAAVTYDRNADGTPNMGSVTLGGEGSTTPVALKNVADAKDDHDALNLGQLKDAGLVGDDGAGNLTSLAVKYDSATKDKVTLEGTNGTTITNLTAGAVNATSMDAVNGSQLYGLADSVASTLGGGTTVGSDGKLANTSFTVNGKGYTTVEQAIQAAATSGATDSFAVRYDMKPDGTIDTDKATLAGTDGTTISNVKAGEVSATSMDAINGSQLHGVSQSVADSLGGGSTVGADGTVTNPTYTLADPTDGSKTVAYDNVGDALSNLDGRTTTNTQNITVINQQLADSGLVDPVTGQSIAAVTYDRNTDGTPNLDKVTLKGTDGTTLSNVKAGVADMDAVNVSQLKDSGLIGDDGKSIAAVTYDDATKGSVTLGGTAATTPVALKNVADAKDDHDALNLGQLKNAGLVGEDANGNLTSAAVTYDTNLDGTINHDKATLAGTDGTTLSNVKAGVADMDAVNVGQLKSAGLIAPVDPTDPGAGLASLAVTYGTNADGTANFDQVKLAGTNGTTITNVKAGEVSATSMDAINGAQLHGVSQSVADSLGGGSTVGTDGTVTNPTYTLADPTDGSKKVAYDNVGDALSNLDGRTTTNTENITVINQQLADSGLVDPVTGQSIAAVTYDRNTDGTPNLGSVTLGGANAAAPVALKNVAAGVDRNDAVNVGQLKDTGLVTQVDPTNPAAGLASLAVTYGKNADGTANFDQVALAGTNGTTITNVHAGAVNATSTDAVNGSQLHGVSSSVAKSLGGGASVDANGNVTNPSYVVNNQTFDNVGDAIENISSSLADGSIGLVQQDETTRDITVAKGTDGTSVNFAGTAGNRVLTGVAAGEVSATSVDAINGSQLHGTAQSVADVIGGGTTVDADGKLADTAIEVNGSKYKTVAEAVQAAAAYGATDSLAVRYDLNGDGTPNFGSVTLGGTGAAPVRLTNVADGTSQYDAVNFGQLSQLSDRIGDIDGRVGVLEQNPGGGGGSSPIGSDYFQATDTGTGTTPANAGTGTGNTAAGSGAVVGTGANNATVVGSNANASMSNGTAIGSGANSSAEGATAIGSGAMASGSNSAAIGNRANASGSNSVALGAGSVATDDNTVSVGSALQQRTISNVADGVNASDAATKGQLDRAMGGMQGQINDLSRNAYSGIAAATALTMIPGVDPGKTISFGVGGATFKGYQAVAFGGEARITQNLKMKAGVGLSSGGNTVGVGASYQW
nr:YadA-like family protein [Burkholderia sp. AU31624]